MCVIFRIVVITADLIVLKGEGALSTQRIVLNVDISTQPVIT